MIISQKRISSFAEKHFKSLLKHRKNQSVEWICPEQWHSNTQAGFLSTMISSTVRLPKSKQFVYSNTHVGFNSTMILSNVRFSSNEMNIDVTSPQATSLILCPPTRFIISRGLVNPSLPPSGPSCPFEPDPHVKTLKSWVTAAWKNIHVSSNSFDSPSALKIHNRLRSCHSVCQPP